MKIQLLNKKIQTDAVTSVLFPFPPIAIPISSDGNIVTEDLATNVHYATVVFNVDDSTFYIFEFGERIKDGLLAYKARHKIISNVEVLMSRESDGSLRMTSSRIMDTTSFLDKEERDRLSLCHDKLYDMYLSKIGKQIQDLEK